jgi:hypothetical protein
MPATEPMSRLAPYACRLLDARALNQPEPAPKRHRVRRLVLAATVAGAATVGYRQLTAKGSVQRDD